MVEVGNGESIVVVYDYDPHAAIRSLLSSFGPPKLVPSWATCGYGSTSGA
jgi:hypothetical protein